MLRCHAYQHRTPNINVSRCFSTSGCLQSRVRLCCSYSYPKEVRRHSSAASPSPGGPAHQCAISITAASRGLARSLRRPCRDCASLQCRRPSSNNSDEQSDGPKGSYLATSSELRPWWYKRWTGHRTWGRSHAGRCHSHILSSSASCSACRRSYHRTCQASGRETERVGTFRQGSIRYSFASKCQYPVVTSPRAGWIKAPVHLSGFCAIYPVVGYRRHCWYRYRCYYSY